MKKKSDSYTFLKEKIDNDTLKLYCFRIDNDNQNYECEEYIYKDKHVLDLKYGESSKEYHDSLISKQTAVGTTPSVYFGYKKMGFKAFGEDWGLEKNTEL